MMCELSTQVDGVILPVGLEIVRGFLLIRRTQVVADDRVGLEIATAGVTRCTCSRSAHVDRLLRERAEKRNDLRHCPEPRDGCRLDQRIRRYVLNREETRTVLRVADGQRSEIAEVQQVRGGPGLGRQVNESRCPAADRWITRSTAVPQREGRPGFRCQVVEIWRARQDLNPRPLVRSDSSDSHPILA